MAKLNIKIQGFINEVLDVKFENAEVNGTLHPIFSGMIDGYIIDKYIFKNYTPGLYFWRNPGNVTILDGEEILQSDMDSDKISMLYDHSYPNGVLNFSAFGPNTIYDGSIKFNSAI